MPSDGAGGRSGGDGDRGSGGRSDSERGDGGSERGYGGYGGLGIGNPGSYGGVNSVDRSKSASVGNQRDTLNNIGWGASALGVVAGGPLGLAGSLARAAAKHGRTDAELTDAERAFRENGMGEGERGRSSERNNYDNGNQQGGNYVIPQQLMDYIGSLAAQNNKYQQLFTSIDSAKSRSLSTESLNNHHNAQQLGSQDYAKSVLGNRSKTRLV